MKGGPADARLRLARPEDAVPLGALHVAAWRALPEGLVSAGFLATLDPRASAAGWRARLTRPEPGRVDWVALAGGQVVGFVGFGLIEGGALGEVFGLYVDPGSWRCGHGSALLRRAREELRRQGAAALCVWVQAGNARARAFYAAQGLELDAQRRQRELESLSLDEVRYSQALVGG